MKTAVVTLLMVLSATALAMNKEKKQEMFEARKARAIESIDKKISLMNTLKSCLSSATDKESLKKCRKTHKEAMKSHRESNKAEREKRKQQREERRKNKE